MRSPSTRSLSPRRLAVSAVAVCVLAAACTVSLSSPPTPPSENPTTSAYSETRTTSAPAPPPGPSLYVAPDGDDEAPGTAAQPLRTIAAAAAAAGPGFTVMVADGTYEGAFTTRASGEPDAPITYVAERKWGARLVADGSGEEIDAVWRNYGDHVVIRGFDISGSTLNGLIQTGSSSLLAENLVHGFAGGSCISTYEREYDLRDIDIIGNVAHSCGSTELDHGIYPGHPGGTVSNNITYGHAGFGIHCWHNCNDLVISNNLVFDNREGGIIIGQGDGPNFGDVDADNMIVTNNIVLDNGNFGIEESGATGPANRYLHNNLFGNAQAGLDLNTGTESGTVTHDPGLVDFQVDGSGDYRLRPDSANVDAGTTVGAPPLDIVGTVRPQGAGVDIGVYER